MNRGRYAILRKLLKSPNRCSLLTHQLTNPLGNGTPRCLLIGTLTLTMVHDTPLRGKCLVSPTLLGICYNPGSIQGYFSVHTTIYASACTGTQAAQYGWAPLGRVCFVCGGSFPARPRTDESLHRQELLRTHRRVVLEPLPRLLVAEDEVCTACTTCPRVAPCSLFGELGGLHVATSPRLH